LRLEREDARCHKGGRGKRFVQIEHEGDLSALSALELLLFLSCKDRAFERVAALRLTSPQVWAFSRIFGHGGKNSAACPGASCAFDPQVQRSVGRLRVGRAPRRLLAPYLLGCPCPMQS
jgi:hypothetical protein